MGCGSPLRARALHTNSTAHEFHLLGGGRRGTSPRPSRWLEVISAVSPALAMNDDLCALADLYRHHRALGKIIRIVLKPTSVEGHTLS